MKWFERENRQRFCFLLASAASILCLAVLFYNYRGILSFAGGILGLLSVMLRPAVIGFAIAYLLFPITMGIDRIFGKLEGNRKRKKVEEQEEDEKKGKYRKSRFYGLSVLITWLVLLMGISLLLTVLIFGITEKLRIVSILDIGNAVTALRSAIDRFYRNALIFLRSANISESEVNQYLQQVMQSIVLWLSNTGNHLLSSAGGIATSVSTMIFSIIFSLYFLLDGDGILRYWKKAAEILLPERFRSLLALVISDADRAFSGYIRGQAADAVFISVVISVVFTVLRIPNAVVIGVLSGFGNLIPYVGPVVAYGGTLLSCAMEGDLQKLVISLIAVFLIQTIDGNIVNPKLLSRSIQVHPLLVVSALLIGGAAGGVLGMLLSVPVGALCKLEFDRYLRYREGKKLQGEEQRVKD